MLLPNAPGSLVDVDVFARCPDAARKLVHFAVQGPLQHARRHFRHHGRGFQSNGYR